MIVQCSQFMESDSRFRRWGKLLTNKDVDLKQKDGYALKGEWVNWDESISLIPGKYLVCAAITGSRKNNSYHYRLVDGRTGQLVDKDDRIADLNVALATEQITEDQRVKAKNSILYSYALWISMQPEPLEESNAG